MRKFIIHQLSLVLLLSGCATQTTVFELPAGLPAVAKKNTLGCSKWEHYVPDPAHPDHLRERLLRVNFHILNSRDSSHNFKPDTARHFFCQLLKLANAQLDSNEANWRSPTGTPVLPKRYRYQLWPQPGDDGFYFHFDDSLYYFVSAGRNANNYSTQVIDKYAVGLDSIINIFALVHPDDSIRSPTYRAVSQGIALGNALKMAGLYEQKFPVENFDGLLNHEVGHILGLNHAWTEDGCPDTDNHPNKCYVCTDEAPCNSLCTNNMMDYNHYQAALTPCQIGRVHATFANEKSRVRRCLVPTWCVLRTERSIVVRDSVAWLGARDLEGNLTVAKGGVLRLGCRVSMPPGSQITVQPGGRLVLDGCRLHNACGKTWRGIFVQERGRRRGTVEIRQTPTLENVGR